GTATSTATAPTTRPSPKSLRQWASEVVILDCSTTGARLAYQPGLDGVRALAVLAVLAYHDGRLRGGFLGVSTFFTLSGFLIAGLLVREFARTQRVSLRDFFGRRIRRLFPAAVAGVLLAAAVAIAL